MVNMLEASRRYSMGLNTEKMQFRLKAVNFYGHKINKSSQLTKSDTQLKT